MANASESMNVGDRRGFCLVVRQERTSSCIRADHIEEVWRWAKCRLVKIRPRSRSWARPHSRPLQRLWPTTTQVCAWNTGPRPEVVVSFMAICYFSALCKCVFMGKIFLQMLDVLNEPCVEMVVEERCAGWKCRGRMGVKEQKHVHTPSKLGTFAVPCPRYAQPLQH